MIYVWFTQTSSRYSDSSPTLLIAPPAYDVVDADGLDAPEADITTEQTNHAEGEVLLGARLAERKVSLTVAIYPPVAENRTNLINFLTQDRDGLSLSYNTRGIYDSSSVGRALNAIVRVDKIECNHFSVPQTARISLTFVKPVFDGIGGSQTDFSLRMSEIKTLNIDSDLPCGFEGHMTNITFPQDSSVTLWTVGVKVQSATYEYISELDIHLRSYGFYVPDPNNPSSGTSLRDCYISTVPGKSRVYCISPFTGEEVDFTQYVTTSKMGDWPQIYPNENVTMALMSYGDAQSRLQFTGSVKPMFYGG